MQAFTVVCVLVFGVAATADQTVTDKAVNSPNGPYQLVAAADGLYLLDTTSGQLWFQDRFSRSWSPIDSPVHAVDSQPRPQLPAAETVQLELAKGGIDMPMVQRESREIPGSHGTLFLKIGDITGGQVFVEVTDRKGNHLLTRTSLAEGDVTKLKVQYRIVYLQLRKLINNLVGQDLCTVHVSYKKPHRRRGSKQPAGAANDRTSDLPPREN